MIPIPKERYMFGANFAFIKFGAWMYPVAVIRRLFPGNYAERMHFHDFPQVWYCHEGRYLHQVGETVHHCRKGSFMVIPAGVWHGFTVPEDATADIFCIEVKYSLFMESEPDRYLNAVANLMLPAFSRELGWTFPEELRLGQASQVQAAEWLSDLSILDFKTSGTQLEPIWEKLEQLFSLPELELPQKVLKKASRLSEQKLRPLIRTLIFLNENYSKKIVADDLLRVAALGHTDFYKCFRRFTGLTYSDYLMQLRNARVTLLLVNTTYSLSSISELCGFSDPAHMSKCYKRQNGKRLKDIRGNARPQIGATKGTEHKLREKLIE